MNYFAHGRAFVDEPYVLAGTAVPDWLSVVDRQVRVRTKHVAPHVQHPDEHVAAIARGLARHFADDAWFHECRAFSELSLDFCVRWRQALGPEDGFRPHFLGHILVEMLLDAALIAAEPDRLRAYYAALEAVDGGVIERSVNQMAPRSTERLAPLVPAFCRERFLWDYGEDGKLLFRLNQVMRRVGLPTLPPQVSDFFPTARGLVAERQQELLAGPTLPTLEQQKVD